MTVMLLVDGVYLTAAMYATGGVSSPMRFLAYLHLVAVTLLASYRTGLKLALWQSLLLMVVLYAQAAGLLPPVDVQAGATVTARRPAGAQPHGVLGVRPRDVAVQRDERARAAPAPRRPGVAGRDGRPARRRGRSDPPGAGRARRAWSTATRSRAAWSSAMTEGGLIVLGGHGLPASTCSRRSRPIPCSSAPGRRGRRWRCAGSTRPSTPRSPRRCRTPSASSSRRWSPTRARWARSCSSTRAAAPASSGG